MFVDPGSETGTMTVLGCVHFPRSNCLKHWYFWIIRRYSSVLRLSLYFGCFVSETFISVSWLWVVVFVIISKVATCVFPARQVFCGGMLRDLPTYGPIASSFLTVPGHMGQRSGSISAVALRVTRQRHLVSRSQRSTVLLSPNNMLFILHSSTRRSWEKEVIFNHVNTSLKSRALCVLVFKCRVAHVGRRW